MTQLALLNTPAPITLSGRQAAVFERIRRSPEGVYETDIGALLHARVRKHGLGERCTYCRFDGLQVLKRLRQKGLVRRERKTGRWHVARQHRQLVPYGPEAEPAELDPFPEGF